MPHFEILSEKIYLLENSQFPVYHRQKLYSTFSIVFIHSLFILGSIVANVQFAKIRRLFLLMKTVKLINIKSKVNIHLPITARCCLSILPENITKPLFLLMFAVGKDKQHRAVMG